MMMDAISVLFEMVTEVNTAIAKGDLSKDSAQKAYDLLKELCDVLGIFKEAADSSLEEEIEKLIEERQQARKDKNFARADEIRDYLKDQGIVLEDTPQGVKWKKA